MEVLASGQDFGTTLTRVHASVARFSRNDSQDLVQEALARAVKHDVRGNLEPWLKTVSRRIAIDNARKAREIASGAADDVDTLTPHSSRGPEDIVLSNEGVGLIRRAMRSLPGRYRDALVAYSEQRDNAAVAERFGLSANATCSLLSRARSRLREELGRVGYAFGGICLKLQRWQHEVATAAAAACFVVVVAASSSAAQPLRFVTTARVAPTTRAVAAVAPGNATAPVANATTWVRAPAVVKHAVQGAEIVRYQVAPCGPRGRALPAPYVSVVRDGRPSLIGAVASRLPAVPAIEAGTCSR